MNNWSSTTLGQIVSLDSGALQTGPFGSQLHKSDYVVSGIPCVMPANIQGIGIDLDGIAMISEKDANRLGKHLVKSGDIIFSRRGDITKKALIRDEQEGYFCGTGCILVRTGESINSEFLIYYLSSPESTSWIVKKAVGITMPNINTKILSDYPIKLPCIAEQKAMAKVLSDLDAKIELNNKVNAELEAMAKLIYDYWFVQFDFPTSAEYAASVGKPNLKGKPYKSSGGLMVYNDELKREIPEGWEVKHIRKLFNYLEGPGIRKFNYSNDGHKFINIKCIQSDDINISDANMIKPELLDTYSHFLLNENDVVVSTSGSLGRSAIVRKEHLPLLLNTSVIRFRPIESYSQEYMVIYLKSQFFLGKLNQLATGSIQKNFGPTHLDEIVDCIPPENTLIAFHKLTKEIISKQIINRAENDKLASLRDWLLPMLMNGQVKVKE